MALGVSVFVCLFSLCCGVDSDLRGSGSNANGSTSSLVFSAHHAWIGSIGGTDQAKLLPIFFREEVHWGVPFVETFSFLLR